MEFFFYIAIALIIGFSLGWLANSNRVTTITEKLRIENAELRKDKDSDAERIKWVESAEKQLKDTFEALSANILSTNADQFLNQSKEGIDHLLKLQKKDWGTQKAEFENLVQPLGKSLEKLDEQVKNLEVKREGAYQSLTKQLTHLYESQDKLMGATSDLNNALRATASRGKWGNVQLRRIAEMAGMQKHIDFLEEVTGKDQKKRPDMIINLPNKGIIPVDAKAPMDAYLDSINIDDENDRQKMLKKHSNAMKDHIKKLSNKEYWKQFDESAEFVVMCIPYDPGLTAAFEQDRKMFEDSLKKKVLMVSPVSLLALLKAISFGWTQVSLSESARKIADEGTVLYNRINIFVGHLSNVGKNLDGSVKTYNKAIASLDTRVSPSLKRLKEMGTGTDEIKNPELLDTPSSIPKTIPEKE